MPVFKRAVLYLARKKSRTAILLAVFFVLSVFAMICLTISIAITKEVHKLQETFATGFTIAQDPYAVVGAGLPPPDDLKWLTNDDIAVLENIDGVKECFTYMESSIWVEPELRYGFIHQWYERAIEEDNQRDIDFCTLVMHETGTYGCYNSEMHRFFRTGAFELIDGRHIRPDDKQKVVISQGLAERNNLNVGDSFNAGTITFTKEYWEATKGIAIEDIDYNKSEYALYGIIPLEIVGIYKINFTQYDGIHEYPNGEVIYSYSEDEYAESAIFSDMYTLLYLDDVSLSAPEFIRPIGENLDPSYSSVTIFVDEPAILDSVIDSVWETGIFNDDYYDTTIDTDAYEASAKPLNQLKTITIILAVIVIVACIVITWLVSSVWSKTRRKEMGILLAVGNSRIKILFQFFTEMIVICVVSIFLAIIITSLILGPLGTIVNSAVSPKDNTDKFSYSFDLHWQERLINV